MQKAAYPIPEEPKELWREVKRFLRDLERLSELFGLVVAAWHPKECVWKPLAELAGMSRSSAGRAWVRGCLLRVYTRDDYLVRWRRFFADRMGFSVIPDPVHEQTVAITNAVLSREGFVAYLLKEGELPQAELAVQLALPVPWSASTSRASGGGRRHGKPGSRRGWSGRGAGVNSLT